MPTTPEVCDALCDVLRAGNEVHRCLAVQALGRIGNPRAVDALTACLMDEDEDVRVDAAEGLGLLGDGRACASLVSSLLGDPCSDVKISAVEALGRLGCRDAAPELRGLARQGDDAANRDDTEWLHEGWDDRLEIQVKAIDALARMGTVEAVPDIVDAIDDEMGQELSETGMKALARLGGPGIEALAHYLKATDGGLRRRAAGAMAGVDSEAARGALAGALQDDWADVRLAAARGVASQNAADPRLVPLFGDADPEVRAAAVRLCGHRFPGRLDAMLDDPSDRVQEAVMGLLAADPRPTPPKDLAERLRIKLRGSSVNVAVAAAAALAARTPEAAFDDLAEQLHDKGRPPAVRCAAARALADIGSGRAALALLQAISDDARRVRLDAMVGLARMAADRRPEPARCALLSALRGELAPPPDQDTRESQPGPLAEPAESLDEGKARAAFAPESDEGNRPEGTAETGSGPSWPISTLEAILGKGTDVVMAQAQEERIELTEEDLEYLELARRVPRKRRVSPDATVAAHRDVPRFAARVLGDVAGEDVARALAAALTDKDTEVRRAAADSLARVGEKMGYLPAQLGDALRAGCAGSERDVRLAATRALAWVASASAAPALVEMLRDTDSAVRAEAVRALAVLGAVGPEVEALLNDPDPGVRLAAAGAVADAGGANAINLLVDFAFAFGGYHRREAGRSLRDVDAAAASGRFLDVLNDPHRQGTWRVAIEVLEELNRSDVAANERPMA